jgi:Skp family chaperone for outer membrane proteins
MKRLTVIVAVLAASLPYAAAPVSAQDYFIPGNQRPAQPGPARPAPAPAPRPAPQPAPAPAPRPLLAPQTAPGSQANDNEPTLQVQLPPVPELPPLPRGASPPAAVIGVMGVPEVMRASQAAQMVDKVIGERREKLNEDAQKEQAAWRDLQQQLASQRSTMSPEQIRNKERDLQDRITNAQKVFRDRNRIIQEAAQVGVGQIERTLVAVIRQVAESHGMNLVLHRAQVALNINEFDITDQVAEQLNKVMPSVVIPAEGVSAAIPVPAAAPGAAPSAPAISPGPRR